MQHFQIAGKSNSDMREHKYTIFIMKIIKKTIPKGIVTVISICVSQETVVRQSAAKLLNSLII